MFTFNISAGAMFGIGIVVGIIVGVVSLAVVAILVSNKNNKED